jgi:hypothetical protein
LPFQLPLQVCCRPQQPQRALPAHLLFGVYLFKYLNWLIKHTTAPEEEVQYNSAQVQKKMGCTRLYKQTATSKDDRGEDVQ